MMYYRFTWRSPFTKHAVAACAHISFNDGFSIENAKILSIFTLVLLD